MHRTQRAPLDEKHAFTFLYDRQQLPAQCEVEVGGDYYYIGPQRAGLPPNLKVRSGISARGVGTEVWSLVTHFPSLLGGVGLG